MLIRRTIAMLGVISALGAAFAGLAGALAHRVLALQVDFVRAVNEAVHNCVRQSRIADDFMMPPFLIA